MWSWQWIPKRMNSQKGFSLTSCALAQSEIPWIQFFDKFRCVPRNLRSGVFFSFFKTKGKKDTLLAVVSPGRTLCPSWRNQCSQGRRRIAWSQIRASCLQLPTRLTWVGFWSAGSAIIVFAPSFPVLPSWSRPSFAGRPRTEFPVTALAAHPACNFSPEVLSWFYLLALKEKSTFLNQKCSLQFWKHIYSFLQALSKLAFKPCSSLSNKKTFWINNLDESLLVVAHVHYVKGWLPCITFGRFYRCTFPL